MRRSRRLSRLQSDIAVEELDSDDVPSSLVTNDVIVAPSAHASGSGSSCRAPKRSSSRLRSRGRKETENKTTDPLIRNREASSPVRKRSKKVSAAAVSPSISDTSLVLSKQETLQAGQSDVDMVEEKKEECASQSASVDSAVAARAFWADIRTHVDAHVIDRSPMRAWGWELSFDLVRWRSALQKCLKFKDAQTLKSMRQCIQKAFSMKNIRVADRLRLIVALVELPLSRLTMSSDSYAAGELFKRVDALEERHSSILARFYSKHAEQGVSFRPLLETFQTFLTSRLKSCCRARGSVIRDCAGFISILHDANELCSPQVKLAPHAFFNSFINDDYDIEHDYYSRRVRSSHALEDFRDFNACDFPFLLHPNSKSLLLACDARGEQQRFVSDAMLRALLFSEPLEPYLSLHVRRDFLVNDTVYRLADASPLELKKPLRVHFRGEEAVDAGGVRKEFFQLIVKELFDAKYGMFDYDDELQQYWFRSRQGLETEFRLVGSILGLAMYNNIMLDLRFPPVVYKKLTIVPPKLDLQDLKQVSPSLGSSLQKLLDMNSEDLQSMGCTFTVSTESFGQVITHDLRPDGSSTLVTEENREEFVRLYTDFHLNKHISEEFSEFRAGFLEVCGSPAYELVIGSDLEMMICGLPELDFKQLESNASYIGFSNCPAGQGTKRRPPEPVVKHFWDIVHSLSNEDQKRLLLFVTGCDRAPILGLKALDFVVQHGGANQDMLPSAHTCFNTLILPVYNSKAQLEAKLRAALENCQGFGLT